MESVLENVWSRFWEKFEVGVGDMFGVGKGNVWNRLWKMFGVGCDVWGRRKNLVAVEIVIGFVPDVCRISLKKLYLGYPQRLALTAASRCKSAKTAAALL